MLLIISSMQATQVSLPDPEYCPPAFEKMQLIKEEAVASIGSPELGGWGRESDQDQLGSIFNLINNWSLVRSAPHTHTMACGIL